MQKTNLQQAIQRWQDKNRQEVKDEGSKRLKYHQWKKSKTVIGVIFECTVCRTWTRKKNNRICPGKEYK